MPQGEGGETRPTNIVEDALGDSGEDPVDDAGVDLVPLTITLHGRGFYRI